MIDDDSSMNGVNGSGTGGTGEAASPGRCPTVWQGGPGRHPGTARMKWSRDCVIVVPLVIGGLELYQSTLRST